MATPVIPAAPAAPSSPAPSAPAPAASTPAISTPAPETGVQAPVESQTPDTSTTVTPAAPGAAGEPKQEDFLGDVEGFLNARNEWERKKDEQPPAVEEAKPAEEVKPPEEAAKVEETPPAVPEPEQVTPEVLNGFFEKSPELKAALDASPEIKTALFAMARTNARLAPLGEIFPNAEAGRFAAETANTMVDIRSGFLEAIDTGDIGGAYDRFADEFAIRDKDGKPVVDADGVPQFDEDFHLMNDHVVDTYHNVEVQDLEARLKAGQFSSDEERENADMALQAFKFIQEYKSGKFSGSKPDLESASPELKAYYERKEQELNAREEALSGRKKEQSTAEKKAERETYELNVQRQIGGSVGKRIGSMLAEKEKSGVFVPRYVLEAKDPKTGISVFAKSMLDQFEESTYGRRDDATGKVVGGVAYIRNQAKMLARREPGADAEKARVDFGLKLVDDFLPGILDKELRKVQNKDIEDRRSRQGNVDARTELTEREPRGGSTPAPKNFTPEQAMAQAYAEVDQKDPNLSPAERTEKALILKNQKLQRSY